jgi:HlyD family secretion protein
MTTSNEVITQVLDSVLYVPLEAVHANDSLTFVYTRSGKRQIVVLGESNENNIVVEMGLVKGDKLYLSLPENPESFEYEGLALMEEIKRRKEEEQKRREEEQEHMKNQQKGPQQYGVPPEDGPIAGQSEG